MPPQVTFIKLTDRSTIPIKVFVKKNPNGKTVSTQDKRSVAINSKSLITLNNQPFQIQLSNDYLNSLVSKLKPELLPILIYNDNLESQLLTIDDNIKVVISLKLILTIRRALGMLDPEHPMFNKLPFSDNTIRVLQVKKDILIMRKSISNINQIEL